MSSAEEKARGVIDKWLNAEFNFDMPTKDSLMRLHRYVEEALTPPTDEEIRIEMSSRPQGRVLWLGESYREGFIDGARWAVNRMKEK